VVSGTTAGLLSSGAIRDHPGDDVRGFPRRLPAETSVVPDDPTAANHPSGPGRGGPATGLTESAGQAPAGSSRLDDLIETADQVVSALRHYAGDKFKLVDGPVQGVRRSWATNQVRDP
jgi:hypothetical protein